MTPRHRVSRTAITLIKRFEGYRRKAAELPDGRWTIGHGHIQTARRGAEVSTEDAEALLIYDLIAITHGINESVFSPLTQNQFDALTSFTFNIGLDSFNRSGVIKRLNEGALIQAACAMELWRKAEVGGERIVIDALVRRRAVEKALFLTPPDDAWVAAPSSILRPLLDTDAIDLVPRQVPAPVTASLEGDAVVVLRDDAPVLPVVAADDDTQGPSRAAAEAVTARLQTIFQDPGEEAAVEPPVHPENIPADPHPQADFAPSSADLLTPDALDDEDDDPFILNSPSEEDEPALKSLLLLAGEDAPDEPRGPDLFDEPPAGDLGADDIEAGDIDAEEPPPVLVDDPPPQEPPAVTDEPFDFLRPMAQPLPEEPRAGIIGLLTLGLVGLAFFAGGIFWATNAGTTPEGALDPRMVGWMAGLAGVGFFVVAIYLLLERLGRASERAARRR